MMFKLATAALLATASLAKAQLLNNYLTDCVPEGEFDPTLDYFPEKYEPPSIFTYNQETDLFGERFVPHNTTDLLEIQYFGYYKILVNKHQNISYLLYQCGTIPPQDEVDSGRHHLVLPVPHQGGVAITQTPQIPPMELLGLREEIIGYIGNPQYVSSPCMLHLMETGDIETVFNPDDPWNSTVNDQMRADYVERNPNVIVFGGPTDSAPWADRTINVAASQERTNVATFDWIALYAALYNVEAMSNQISSETQARYDCTSTNARLIANKRERGRVLKEERTLQEEATKAIKPLEKSAGDIKILWADYFTGYNWSVADCRTWDHTYYCEYAEHCGTQIISRPPEMGTEVWGYWYLNNEEFLELAKDADIFIFQSNRWDSVYALHNETMDQIKAVQNGQVYDTQGSGSNSWYEQRLAEYDVVGLDMCDLVGTANPNGPPHVRRWFRNIYSDPIGSLPACKIPEELTEPYVPNGAECTVLTEDDFEAEAASAAGVASVVGGFAASLLSMFMVL